jgi:hypothetical protein
VEVLDHTLDALPRWPAPQIRFSGAHRASPGLGAVPYANSSSCRRVACGSLAAAQAPSRRLARHDVPASLIPRSGTQRIVTSGAVSCTAGSINRHRQTRGSRGAVLTVRSTLPSSIGESVLMHRPVPRIGPRHNALGRCGDYT